jgi:hypothetical protein
MGGGIWWEELSCVVLWDVGGGRGCD